MEFYFELRFHGDAANVSLSRRVELWFESRRDREVLCYIGAQIARYQSRWPRTKVTHTGAECALEIVVTTCRRRRN